MRSKFIGTAIIFAAAFALSGCTKTETYAPSTDGENKTPIVLTGADVRVFNGPLEAAVQPGGASFESMLRQANISYDAAIPDAIADGNLKDHEYAPAKTPTLRAVTLEDLVPDRDDNHGNRDVIVPTSVVLELLKVSHLRPATYVQAGQYGLVSDVDGRRSGCNGRLVALGSETGDGRFVVFDDGCRAARLMDPDGKGQGWKIGTRFLVVADEPMPVKPETSKP
ncbi:MAG: hypothetical protein V4480_00420 [Patescibacteria group bacterium]